MVKEPEIFDEQKEKYTPTINNSFQSHNIETT